MKKKSACLTRIAGPISFGLAAASCVSVGHAAVSHARVQGSITAVHGDILNITTYGGKKVRVTIGAHSRFVSVAPSRLSKVTRGEFVGVGATGPKRRLKALEVVIFPASMRGSGEGHYPWSLPARVAAADMRRHAGAVAAGAPPVRGSMTNGVIADAATKSGAPPVSGSMTNGAVAAAKGVDHGKELTIAYKGGKVKILVPAGAPVVRLVPANRGIVKPGDKAFIIASSAKAGAPLKAQMIAVGEHGLLPPM